MWSAVVARELGIISAGRVHPEGASRPCGRCCGWSTTSRAACTTTGTTRPPARLILEWPGTRRRRVYPSSPASTTAGSAPPSGWSRNAVPGAADLARRCSTGCAGTPSTTRNASRPGGLMHGGFFTQKYGHDRPGGVLPGHPHRRRGRLADDPPLRHHRLRDPDHLLPRHHDRPGPGPALLRGVAHLPGDLRLELARDAAGGGDPHLPGHRRLRGRLHLPRHAHRPRLGRLDVRGADAQRLRPRGGVGPALVGSSTTRCTSALRSSTAWSRPATATGASRRPATRSRNYREYGVDALGLNPEGYFSDLEKTNYDVGFGECRAATNPNPDFGDGVVTPHAPFLAMMHAPAAAYDNLVAPGGEPRRLRPGRLLRRRRRGVAARSPSATCRSTRRW